jgi:Rod binding domain-containing protein
MKNIESTLAKLITPQHSPQKKQKLDPHDPLVQQAQKLVSQTFYGTLLKQARNSPFKSEIFDGGRGGQAFGEMLDQHLADHMSRSTGSKLVGALAHKLSANGAYKKHKSPSPFSLSAATRAGLTKHA